MKMVTPMTLNQPGMTSCILDELLKSSCSTLLMMSNNCCH